MSDPTSQAKSTTRFMLTLEPGLREEADTYVAAINERIYPAELTLTRLINTALRSYIAESPKAQPASAVA